METRTYDVDGLYAEADIPESARGWALVAHGLGGRADQRHLLALRRTLALAGYAAVSWDSRDTLESRSRGGSMAETTLTRHISDMEAIASWARSMPWGTGPYLVGGHSLGGFAALVHAVRHQDEVAGIFPVATVYSGPRWWVARQQRYPEEFRRWQREGVRYEASLRHPGKSKEVPWKLAEDYLRYDVLMDSDRITVPVCMAVGTLDDSTPPEEQRYLRDSLSNARVSYAEIPGMPHTPRSAEHIEALAEHLSAWLRENFAA